MPGPRPQLLTPATMAVLVARYGPGMYEPAAAVSLPAPGPLFWDSLLAVVLQPRLQQVLLGWAMRMLPALLYSGWRLLAHRQAAAGAAAAAAAALKSKGAAAAPPSGAAAKDSTQRFADMAVVVGGSGSNKASAAQQAPPSADAAPANGTGLGPGPGQHSVPAAAAGAATNGGELIRMAMLKARPLASAPGECEHLQACYWPAGRAWLAGRLPHPTPLRPAHA